MKLTHLARTALAVAALALGAPFALAQAEPPAVRADTKAFLEASKTRQRPPMSDEGVKMMRRIPPEMMARMFAEIEAPLGVIAVDRALTMPGPVGTIDLRLFDPRAERPAGPVVVLYHGGGFVAGGIATHAPLAAEMARQLDLPVVSVEYRLAPENKWPAAPDDAEAAARWIAANGKALGREVDGLILTGDSAGGTLTLVTAMALRDKPAAVPLKLLIPLYPMADASRSYPSMEAFSDGYGLNRPDMDFFEKAYAADKNSPRHSALLGDVRGLPPTVLATASLDPLRDGGRAFAAKLIAAGVPVAYYEAAGTVHGFATYRKAIPSAQGDLDRIMALARAMLRP
ncbi:MAG: alpha/beta hydrolase [Novosphingobium sp.]|nr:alpha/beta hydrolase [Novosphingobium sp.]